MNQGYHISKVRPYCATQQNKIEEIFYVLEGEVDLRCGKRTLYGGPGTFVLFPLEPRTHSAIPVRRLPGAPSLPLKESKPLCKGTKLVQASLARRGFVVDFWRIAMRPGKPLMFGRLGDLPVLGMPGNPVSALVCALLFLRPALRAMLEITPAVPGFETAILGAAMPENDQREDYVRARLDRDGNHAVALPLPAQDGAHAHDAGQGRCADQATALCSVGFAESGS